MPTVLIRSPQAGGRRSGTGTGPHQGQYSTDSQQALEDRIIWYNAKMKGYINNIEEKTLNNSYFREVLYTDERLQLVVMSLLPKEEIGEEVHELDQFIRVEKGTGKAVLDGVESDIADGSAVIVPKGALHNIINTSDAEAMKLYTLYAPPNHKEGTLHKTKLDAEADEAEHFDGRTTE
jgi:mannose-6-phosphate isomerase-like protein (cupin superfamily)